MSPPVPSVPLRRASGSGTSMWTSLAGAGGMMGIQSLPNATSATTPDGQPIQFWGGRRASMPWNIHPSFGAPGGPRNLGVSFSSPFGAPASASTGNFPLGKAWAGPRLSLTPADDNSPRLNRTGSGSRSGGASPTSIPEDREMSDPEEDDESEDDTEEETVHERIERELNQLEEGMRTGVRFIRAEQGMRLAF